jgi:hypothetical protein
MVLTISASLSGVSTPAGGTPPSSGIGHPAAATNPARQPHTRVRAGRVTSLVSAPTGGPLRSSAGQVPDRSLSDGDNDPGTSPA